MSVGRKCLEPGPGPPTRPLSWGLDRGRFYGAIRAELIE